METRLAIALSLLACGCGGFGDQTNLKYWGGRVLARASVRTVYLGDYFETAEGLADAEYNDAFVTAVLSDPGYASVWRQYGAGAGSAEPSVFLADSAARVTRESLKALAASIAATDPRWSPELIYNFVLAPGVVLEMTPERTSSNGLGGLHSSVHLPDGRSALLTAVAYSVGANGFDLNGNARDNITVLESHELTEAATDPDIGDASPQKSTLFGWVTDTGEELADLTMNDVSDGSPRTEMFDRLPEGFAVQRLWSIVDQTSEISARPR